jgi:hypothetical protein
MPNGWDPVNRRPLRTIWPVLAAAYLSLLFAALPSLAAEKKPCSAYKKAQAELVAAQKDFLSCVAAAKGKGTACKAKGELVLALTAKLEPGAAALCDPGPSFSSGLGADVDKAIDKSPKFRDMIKALLAKGYTIEYGKAGGGTYISKTEKKIVIDESQKGNIAAVLQSLAHEAGHAGYTDKYTSPNGLTKDQYVDLNVKDRLADEGEATLVNLELRADLKANGGVSIGVAGANAKKYEAIYQQYLKDGDREKARRLIGEIFAKHEHPSTDPSKTYWDYYAKPYQDYYDTWKKTQGQP